jgi:DNA-binding beta-propeller fold protein YncE
MTEINDTTRPLAAALSAPRRNNYYYAKMMDVLHFQMEQSYGQQMRWLGNRLTMGSGVLCGLEVTVKEGVLCVGPGAAIDPLGREILVPVTTCLDLTRLDDPCGDRPGEGAGDEPGRGRIFTLSVCYRECLTDHAPVLVADCQTKETCAAGTVVETFRFAVQPGLPERPVPGLCARCGARLFPKQPKDGAGDVTGVELDVVATVNLDGAPVSAAASPDGRVVVVVNQRLPPVIHVFDAETLEYQTLFPSDVTAPVGGVSFAPDGGPALITSATGVAVVDVSRPTPKLLGTILPGKNYGPSAAALGGRLLFAIDRQTGDVDCVDVAEKKVRQTLDTRGAARDLAVSSDGRWLHVTSQNDHRILRFLVSDLDRSSELGGFEQPDQRPGFLALRSQGTGWQPFVARGSELLAVQTGGASEVALEAVNARDIAFTTDGELLYLVSAREPGTTRPDELVVYGSDGTTVEELARLPVGANPFAVAIVPARLRAFITNTGGQSVTVVDGRVIRDEPEPFDRRRVLCKCTAGPCPKPTECCVPLAAIRVDERGRIVRVDPCAVRRRLYSNEMLLDLILCLAERLDECCGHEPRPDPDPPDPPDPDDGPDGGDRP